MSSIARAVARIPFADETTHIAPAGGNPVWSIPEGMPFPRPMIEAAPAATPPFRKSLRENP